jgi:hypothetical protein
MAKQTADETVTVRLPKGTARKLVAATGQPFSRLVRFVVLEMLAKYQTEGRMGDAKRELQGDVASVVQSSELPSS